MEIPTYPYDQEYASTGMKLKLYIDRLFRKNWRSNWTQSSPFQQQKPFSAFRPYAFPTASTSMPCHSSST